jgi:hypothetical protein
MPRCIVPGNCRVRRRNFRHFLVMLEPIEAKSVSYRGTAPEDKMPASIRFPVDFLGISGEL